jgi:hypothetical protein
MEAIAQYADLQWTKLNKKANGINNVISISGCLVVWLSGCLVVWLSGCLVVW